MTTDIERLVAVLEMRANQFERALKRADKQADRRFKSIEKRADRMEKRVKRSMNRAAAALKSFGAGAVLGGVGAFGTFAALVSVPGAFRKATEAIADFDAVAKRARDAGLDSDFYQALIFGAGEASISQDKLNTALVSFTRNAGLAAAGKGALAENLKVLNPELLESIKNARSQEERFRIVANAVQEAESATEKAAIATSAFGKSGGELVRILDNGAAGFEQMAQKAERLGLIVDRRLLQQAEDLQNEYGNLTQVIDTQLKQAFIDLAPVLNDIARLAAQVARFIADVADSYRNLENRTSRGLTSRLSELDGRIGDLRSGRNRVGPGLGSASESQAELARLLEERRRVAAEIFRRGEQDSLRNLPPPIVEDDGGGGGGGGRSQSISEAERLKKRIDDLVASLEFEAAQLGRTSEQQELYNNLKRGGVEESSAEGQVIAEATQALQLKRQEIEANAAALERATQTGEAFGASISNALNALIAGGADARQVVAQLVVELARAVLQAQVLSRTNIGGGGGGFGQGFIGALVNGIAGAVPAFATGTPSVPRTGLALVHKGERIIPAAQNRAGMGQSAPITVYQTFSFDGYVSRGEVIQIAGQAGQAAEQSVRRQLGGMSTRLHRDGRLA